MMKRFISVLVVCLMLSTSGLFAASPEIEKLEQIVMEMQKKINDLQAERADDNRTIVPIGSIVATLNSIDLTSPRKGAPKGWLFCDGDKIPNDEEYKSLRIYLYGGEKEAEAKTPDLRGVFLRGLDNGKGYDPDRKLLAFQNDSFSKHQHSGRTDPGGNHNHGANAEHGNAQKKEKGSGGLIKYADGEGGCTPTGFDSGGNDKEICIERTYAIPMSGDHRHVISPEGGTETRPKNISVNYIIKY